MLVTGVVMLLSASSTRSQNVFRHVSRYGGCGDFLYFENLFPNRKHWHGNQTIQEALAGAKRVGEFLELPTRLETSEDAGEKAMTELGKASAASGSDYAVAAGSGCAAAAGSDRAAVAEPAKSPAVACISWKTSASAMKRKRWF